MQFAIERLFYEENREMFSVPEKSSLYRKVRNIEHGGTLNSCLATSPLVRVEGKKRWVTPNHPQGILSQNWDKTKPKRTVTCMVLKPTDNDRCTSSPLQR
ncbi:hypothetical protein TNCV_2973601 [Trichonephila clavipes]|nr:hypothetical protein TNCV_2973601 [Trichonephila clavipes]